MTAKRVKQSSELSQNVPMIPKTSQNVQFRRIVVRTDLLNTILLANFLTLSIALQRGNAALLVNRDADLAD